MTILPECNFDAEALARIERKIDLLLEAQLGSFYVPQKLQERIRQELCADRQDENV